MIITFCGHSEISYEAVLEDKILDILKTEAHEVPVDFYLGGYGAFDSLANKCCKRFQQQCPNVKRYFITPYIDEAYLKNRSDLIKTYDGSIYPDIESVPKKFAISARNKWMVQKADLVIAYVNCQWGGAAAMLEYAKRTKVRYINLALPTV